MRFALVLALLLALGAVVFALQNPAEMTVRIGPWIYSGSTAIILILTFGSGVLTAFLASVPGRWSSARQIKLLQKERTAAVKEPSMGTPPPSTVKSPAELPASPTYAPPGRSAHGTDPYTMRFGKPPHDVDS